MSPDQPTTLGDFTKLLDALREQAALQSTMKSINQALVDLIQHLDGSAKSQAAAIRDALEGLSIPAPTVNIPPGAAPWKRIEVTHTQDKAGVITKSVISRIE